MENSLKALIIGTAVVICCVVMSVIFYVGRVGTTNNNNAVTKSNNLTKSMTNYNIEKYDGEEISGQQVLSLIDKYDKDKNLVSDVADLDGDGVLDGQGVQLVVQSRKTPDGFSDFRDSALKDSPYYIYPQGKFIVNLIYDANEVLVGVYFVQQES